jgi:cytochrome c peroxidase
MSTLNVRPVSRGNRFSSGSRWILGALTLAAVGACSTSSTTTNPEGTGGQAEGTGGRAEPLPLTGEQLFSTAFPKTNGRTCATCHVPEDNFSLTAAHVEKVWEEDPSDPLFAAIDADDPEAKTLTFDHLKKGLVRVWLTVPDNMDLLNADGEVITPADRQMFVWRGVPSIADAALTAPYQRDGRMETLEAQAQGAVTGHSEGGTIATGELKRIAEFERTIFSSERAETVAQYLAEGGDPAKAPNAEDELELNEEEERGRLMYEAVCGTCHGGHNLATIADRKIHDLAFPALKPDGTVVYEVPATKPPTLVLAEQSNNEFLNVASAMEMYLAQLGATEHISFTKDVSFPNYRYRFYTDDTRTEVAADLPPLASFVPGGGGPGGGGGAGGADGGGAVGFNIELDEAGNPIVGPNFAPQFFSTDPGRAMITGSPYDFEGFDVPTLRGISKTAPYFHNNTAATLEEAVQLYSDHLLNRFPSLTQPGEKEVDPDGDVGAEEIFTAQQKTDLIAYLKRL